MENDERSENKVNDPVKDSTDIDHAKSVTHSSELTEGSTKTTTVVVNSENSVVSSSSLSTEALHFDEDKSSVTNTSLGNHSDETCHEELKGESQGPPFHGTPYAQKVPNVLEKPNQLNETRADETQLSTDHALNPLIHEEKKTSEFNQSHELMGDMTEVEHRRDLSADEELKAPKQSTTEIENSHKASEFDVVNVQPSEEVLISENVTTIAHSNPKIVADPTQVEKVSEEMSLHIPSTHTETKDMASAEIQEENIKNQLHEIIKEIDKEVGNDENELHHHTWKPKGYYEVKRTPIKYEEIIPIDVPEVKLSEREKTPPQKIEPEVSQQPPKEEIQPHSQLDSIRSLHPRLIGDEPASPVEIPVGIPLLARILPRPESEDEEPHEKIPLERLFTPATDAEMLVPHHKKKAFASSCFYRPDHPTIDDQVELAHKISVSLVDENNKCSKGQNMYMKRKNRSSKWVHQGEEALFRSAAQYEMDEVEEEKKPSMEKPPLKLLLNPKGMQDYTAVQRHYEELMTAAEIAQAAQQMSRNEMGKDMVESPTGKGAALFAKRKKRMDKFIVDETHVQQQQQQHQQANSFHEESMMTSSTSSYDIIGNSSQLESCFDSSATNQLPQLNTSMNGLPLQLGTPAATTDNLQLPDISHILIQPKTTKNSVSSSVSSRSAKTIRSHSADSKPFSRVKREAPAPVCFLNDSCRLMDSQIKLNTTNTTLSTPEVANIKEPGAIYKAEVKVIQKPSLPPVIDFSIPPFVENPVLEHFQTTKEEKRKSFNLAAKGWGTYNKFYTPMHLGTA